MRERRNARVQVMQAYDQNLVVGTEQFQPGPITYVLGVRGRLMNCCM
jgi:hypothetical protein